MISKSFEAYIWLKIAQTTLIKRSFSEEEFMIVKNLIPGSEEKKLRQGKQTAREVVY